MVKPISVNLPDIGVQTYDNSEAAIEATVVELKKMVGKHSLSYVIEMLSRICREKEEESGDIQKAGDWGHDSDKLAKVAGHLFN